MPRADTLLDPALDAVHQASIVCRHVQRRLHEMRAMTKDDRSPVTIADFAAQAIVAAILAEADAAIPLVGEESSEFLRQPEHAAHLAATVLALRDSGVWPDATEADVLAAVDRGSAEPAASGFFTLDPVDGTKGFLRAEQYCVCLAYIRQGVVELGVLGCPNLAPTLKPGTDLQAVSTTGSTYWAIRGDGAMMAFDAPGADASVETNIERADITINDQARLAESVEATHTRQDLSARIVAMASPAGVLPAVRIDSQCKYAVVARGDADVYLRLPSRKGYVERIWDHAAGTLIAAEAGCTVSDAAGLPLDFSQGKGLERNTGIVAAPPSLHARLIQAIGTVA
ncbi:MAG: 3'(2'),5'-bisphosphate nucleotidase [Phycisphaerales bacterium]|nr:3'(2'),5'-bisphosphate nucleotidase [Phycisphaerales bacterium]